MTENNTQAAECLSHLTAELDITKKMQKLLYRLTKDAAKSSCFSEYLEYLDISWDEYATIKNILKESLNVDLYV